MAGYPDWVLQHKMKGTYINKVGDKYYLYAAHSERVPGTKRVKRICDGYLGRITQENGLIPPKPKVQTPFITYEFGLSSLVFSLCTNIHKGFLSSFHKYGDFIMVASILTYIFGFYSKDLLQHSWLSLQFPDIEIPDTLTSSQKNALERGERMITDTMNNLFSSEITQAKSLFSLVTLVFVNNELYCCEIPSVVNDFIHRYQLEWRPGLWLK